MNDRLSADFPELNEFLKTFARNVSWAREEGRIQDDFLTTTEWNSESVAHSRIHALIAKSGFDLDYVVEVEAGFKPKQGRQFKPDVQLWKSNDIRFLIEYESTNSADTRVLRKDLKHYVDSLANDMGKLFPEYWLIIYTFPDSAVNSSKWHSWDYLKQDTKYKKMTDKPHQFYREVFKNPRHSGIPDVMNHLGICEYSENRKWNERKIFLINLTVNGLEIDFPERFNTKYPLQTRTE